MTLAVYLLFQSPASSATTTAAWLPGIAILCASMIFDVGYRSATRESARKFVT